MKLLINSTKLCLPLAIFGILGSAEAQILSQKSLAPLVVQGETEDQKSILQSGYASTGSVIDAKTISQSGARSVADLLVSKGGIRLTSLSGQASNGTLHLRGYGENSSSRLLILVDGRPTNRADMGSLSLLEVPISRIDKVEILRGSQTARFGNNAVAGVINIITKTGKDTPNAIEFAAGSDETIIARGSYNHTVDGHRLGLDLENNQSDGWRHNSAHDLFSSAIRWDKTFNSWIAADFSAGYALEKFELPDGLSKTDYLTNPRKSKISSYGPKEHFTEQTRWNTSGTLLLGGDADQTVEIPFYFQQTDARTNLGSYYYPSYTNNLTETYQLRPVMKWKHEKFTAQAGIDSIRDTLGVTQFTGINRKKQSADADLTRDRIGAHASGDIEVADGWFFNAAARFERSSIEVDAVDADDALGNFKADRGESNHAFQLGTLYEISENHSAWLRYDKLYRLASTDELSSYQGYPLSKVFNDELNAETGDNIEIGTEWTPGNATFGVNVFAQWLTGEILYDGSKKLNVNFANTRRIGSEVHFSYVMDHWNLDLRYAAIQAKYQNGAYEDNHVHLVPNHEVSGSLSYSPIEKLTLSTEYQFNGNSYEIGDTTNTKEKIPYYQLVSLMARYNIKSDLMVYARINNLFDEHYAISKSYGDWYPGAGRQYLVGLRYEF